MKKELLLYEVLETIKDKKDEYQSIEFENDFSMFSFDLEN